MKRTLALILSLGVLCAATAAERAPRKSKRKNKRQTEVVEPQRPATPEPVAAPEPEPEPEPEPVVNDLTLELTAEQVDQLARVVDEFGCNVVCYGLRTDFKSRLFEGSRRLFEIADTIDEIKSTCTCGRKTIVNARIDSHGDFVEEGAQVEIGGDDRYIAVCRKCWRERRISQSRRNVLPFPDLEAE